MTIFAYIVFMLIEWVGGLEKVQTFADVVYGWYLKMSLYQDCTVFIQEKKFTCKF